MALIADPDLTMFVFTAEVGSKSEEALNLLASWSATPDPETPMQITRNNLDTGSVYVDTIAAPSDSSRLSASSVHFTPGARTAWHMHPIG